MCAHGTENDTPAKRCRCENTATNIQRKQRYQKKRSEHSTYIERSREKTREREEIERERERGREILVSGGL